MKRYSPLPNTAHTNNHQTCVIASSPPYSSFDQELKLYFQEAGGCFGLLRLGNVYPYRQKNYLKCYNVAQKCDSVCFWSVFTNRKLCTSSVVLWETSPKCWQPSGSGSSTPGGGATTVRTSVDVLVKGSGHTISCVVFVLVSGAGFSASLAPPFFSSSLGRLVLVPEWASLRMRQIKI